MSSCIIGEIHVKNEYASEQLVFSYSESALYEQIYVLEMAARMSSYANAASDSAMKAIAEQYLVSSKIWKDSGKWYVENKSGTWMFSSNDIPLEKEGAIWKVALSQSYNPRTLIPDNSYTISCTDSKKWNMEISNMESEITNRLTSQTDYEDYFSFKSYGNLEVTASEPDSIQPFIYNYAIQSGAGGFIPNKNDAGHINLTVAYSIKSPMNLRYNSDSYIFVDGGLLMNVLNESNEIVESFQANIYTSPGDREVKFK
jgi:hypothetical protein